MTRRLIDTHITFHSYRTLATWYDRALSGDASCSI